MSEKSAAACKRALCNKGCGVGEGFYCSLATVRADNGL